MFEIPRRPVGLAAIVAVAFGLVAAGCGSSSSSGGGGQKIALLLPENKTARYETQDRPLFEKQIKADCPKCSVLYSNANQDPAKQQAQAEAALTQGAKVLVLDVGGRDREACEPAEGAGAGV
jgi:D-xylose transport system substrate-binding protein